MQMTACITFLAKCPTCEREEESVYIDVLGTKANKL